MKKTIVFITIFILALDALAQIEMFDESIQKKKEIKILPYDSLTNVKRYRYKIGDKYEYTFKHLIGQTMMYCGDPYVFCSNNTFEKGCYYKVENILPDSMFLFNRIQLTNLQTGGKTEENDIEYKKFNYKWVVVGHYEKMKKNYLNKEFVYVGFNKYCRDKADGLINLETDTVTTNIPKESIWTCVGVQVKPRKKDDGMMLCDYRSPIVLIMDNPIYGKHYCYIENSDGETYKSYLDETMPLLCGRFQLKSYYDNVKAITASKKAKRKAELIKKYGADNAEIILEGKVRIGMTKTMCEEAWGHPDEINKMTGSWGTDEQWVYGNSYLYFENGELTTIQN